MGVGGWKDGVVVEVLVTLGWALDGAAEVGPLTAGVVVAAAAGTLGVDAVLVAVDVTPREARQ